jgi:hypothetical protein
LRDVLGFGIGAQHAAHCAEHSLHVLPIQTLASRTIPGARLLDEAQHRVFLKLLGVGAEQYRQGGEQRRERPHRGQCGHRHCQDHCSTCER